MAGTIVQDTGICSNIGKNKFQQLKILESLMIEMYQDIIPELNSEQYYDPFTPNSLEKIITDILQLHQHEFHKMRYQYLDIDVGFPISWRDAMGRVMFIQLRKINKNKILLGCGNNPTTICYHHPIHLEFDQICIDYWKKLKKDGFCRGIHDTEMWAKHIINETKNDLASGIDHNHEDFITIDVNPAMNPTIIGFFGWYKIPKDLIPDNSMEEIYSEGIFLQDMKNFRHDYARITGRKYM